MGKCAKLKLKVDLVTNLPKSESKSKSKFSTIGLKSGLQYHKSAVMGIVLYGVANVASLSHMSASDSLDPVDYVTEDN